MRGMINFVKSPVGDLGKLNEIDGESKYYEQIATETKKERLLPYLEKINK